MYTECHIQKSEGAILMVIVLIILIHQINSDRP